MPTCWAAKQMTLVVPPNAAAVVALSNVSALTRPAAESCSIWACGSTPPGSTSLPRASISRPARASPCPSAATVSPRMPTSAAITSLAVATVPPRITRSKASSMGQSPPFPPSCPALCRASRSLHYDNIKDVDGRDKSGHDEKSTHERARTHPGHQPQLERGRDRGDERGARAAALCRRPRDRLLDAS